MEQEVFVTKTTLINLLGASALSFAMFISGDTLEGKAIRVLFENVDRLDLNCEFVKQYMIPVLVANNAIAAGDVARINDYVTAALS